MNLKQNIFLTGGHDLPTLYTDMVLVESTRAILFTCKSEFDDLYICACHCANSEKVEWLVAPTTPNRVIDLLTNKLTIRNMFDKESLLFLVTLMAGEKTLPDIIWMLMRMSLTRSLQNSAILSK